MEVIHGWAKGMKFAEIMKLTEVFEGTVIRAVRRLEELLRQLALAAKAIGNTDLSDKFEAGRELIKRDIIFAASLYL
jgi:ATP-dependent RNA helicase DOB1